MGDMFAPIGEYVKDNSMQLHQGMAIENIVLFYAYAFTLATIIGAVLLIMVARRIRPGRLDDEAVTQFAAAGGPSETVVIIEEPDIPAVSVSAEPAAHAAGPGDPVAVSTAAPVEVDVETDDTPSPAEDGSSQDKEQK